MSKAQDETERIIMWKKPPSKNTRILQGGTFQKPAWSAHFVAWSVEPPSAGALRHPPLLGGYPAPMEEACWGGNDSGDYTPPWKAMSAAACSFFSFSSSLAAWISSMTSPESNATTASPPTAATPPAPAPTPVTHE